MEVDVTEKVTRAIKFGVLGLFLLVFLAVGSVWFLHARQKYMMISDASVASTMVNAQVKVDGKIVELLVQDGEHVEAGDVIARLAVNVTEEQLQQLEQTVELSKRNLAEVQKGQMVTVPSGGGYDPAAQERLAQAEARMNRMEELFAMGAISAMKRDEAQAAYAAAQAAASVATPSYQTTYQPSSPEVIQAAELQVRQAEAALENARKDSQSTEIAAPVSGTIYMENISEGAEVKAGENIARIGDAGNIWLEVRVPLNDEDKVRLGQFVNYEIEGHDLQGTVLDIKKPEADTGEAMEMEGTEGNLPEVPADSCFTVRISLPGNTSFELKPGMKASAKFSLRS